MPTIQYAREPNIRITKSMFTPKRKMQDPMIWYKEAQKLIKQLPNLCDQCSKTLGFSECVVVKSRPAQGKDHWYLCNTPEISVRWIKFTLMNGLDERAHLVIDRQGSSIGM